MGDIIYRLRINKKLSQVELARLCGVTQQAINRIEKGKAKVSVETLVKLAEALGTTTDVILGVAQEEQSAS
jgi:putative transcriptional regulator